MIQVTSRSLRYKEKSIEKIRAYDRARGHDPIRKEYQKRYENSLLKTNPNYMLAKKFRNIIYHAIVRNTCILKAENLLGCSIAFYRNYLSTKFIEDMSWDNYGKWHIDHIIPLFSFDLSKEDQVKIALNFKNTQPIWPRNNIKKRDLDVLLYKNNSGGL